MQSPTRLCCRGPCRPGDRAAPGCARCLMNRRGTRGCPAPAPSASSTRLRTSGLCCLRLSNRGQGQQSVVCGHKPDSAAHPPGAGAGTPAPENIEPRGPPRAGGARATDLELARTATAPPQQPPDPCLPWHSHHSASEENLIFLKIDFLPSFLNGSSKQGAK